MLVNVIYTFFDLKHIAFQENILLHWFGKFKVIKIAIMFIYRLLNKLIHLFSYGKIIISLFLAKFCFIVNSKHIVHNRLRFIGFQVKKCRKLNFFTSFSFRPLLLENQFSPPKNLEPFFLQQKFQNGRGQQILKK